MTVADITLREISQTQQDKHHEPTDETHLEESNSETEGRRGLGPEPGGGSWCLMGAEAQCGKMEKVLEMVGLAAMQRCERTQRH